MHSDSISEKLGHGQLEITTSRQQLPDNNLKKKILGINGQVS